jgi:signal transduction histidine kinase
LYAHPEDYCATGRTRFNIDAPLQPDGYAIEYRRKDGSTFIGETIAVQLRDDAGHSHGFVGVTRDLTEQLEFEAERRQIVEQIERSRAFLAETERMARIGGAEMAVPSGEVFWSEGFLRLYGVDEAGSLTFEQALSHYEPQARAKLEEAFERATRDGEPFDYELPFEDAQHNKLWVRTAVWPVCEGGEVRRVRGYIQDISAQRNAEHARREFLALVSHELRSPLTALLGTLGLMNRQANRLSAEMSELVGMALRNGKRLGVLVDDILDVEKLEAGQMTLELEHFDLSEVVQDVVMAVRDFAYGLDVELRLDRLASCRPVLIDVGRFEQVLTNLISNAVKFSEAGDVVDVKVSTTRGDWVRVSVVDHGPGIPEEFQDRLFDKFSQAASSTAGRRRGTGLGLHIAKALTQAMGGHIGFGTTSGVGTTIHVEFPLVQ